MPTPREEQQAQLLQLLDQLHDIERSMQEIGELIEAVSRRYVQTFHDIIEVHVGIEELASPW